MPTMEIIRGMHNIRPEHYGCVATIGKFDGVHHGHRMLLAHLKAKRDELGVPSLLITFEPLPREFFEGANRPARLTRFRERVKLLSGTGLDRVLCLPFNEQLRAVTAEMVIDDFLVRRLGVRYVVVGDNFQFGRNREGNYAMLKAAGDRHGFGVTLRLLGAVRTVLIYSSTTIFSIVYSASILSETITILNMASVGSVLFGLIVLRNRISSD